MNNLNKLMKKVTDLVEKQNKETNILVEKIIAVKNGLMVDLNNCNEALKALGFKVEDDVKQIVKEVPGPVQYVTKEVKVDISEEAKNNYEATISKLTTTIIDLKAKLTKVNKETKTVTVVDNSKELEDLRKQLEAEKKSKQTWQSKYTKSETELKAANEQIKDLKSENRKLLKDAIALQVEEKEIETVDGMFSSDELPETKEPVMTDEEVAEIEANEHRKNIETKTEEKEEVIEEIPMHDRLVLLKKYNCERRDDVKFYANNYYYVMASENCNEITVIPRENNINVTDEIIASLQKELVTIGYRAKRECVSPATVIMNKGYLQGYFARTDAKDGRIGFSGNDFFGGYVRDCNRAYLWSWDGKSELCAVFHLDKVIVGDNKNKSVTTATAKMVTKEVKSMYKDYLSKVTVIQKEKEEVIARNTAAMNAKTAAMNAHNAKFNVGNSSNNINMEVVETEKEKVLSEETQRQIDGF